MEVVLEGKGIAKLDFSSHNAATASAAERTAVEAIETLNASRNHIFAIARLTVFRNLVVLNLSHNRLTSPIDVWLRELPRSIRELNLSHNEISTLVAAGAGTQQQRPRGSSVRDAFCDGPDAFHQLEVLDLSGNLLAESLAGADRKEEKRASRHDGGSSGGGRLAAVNLSDNSGVSSVNTLLSGLRGLRKVFLDGNRIASLEGLLSLAACPALEQITIRGCDVEKQLEDPTFLENTFAVERHEVRTSGIGQLFVACFVGQVLPRVQQVNDVETAMANDIILPIIQIAHDSQLEEEEQEAVPEQRVASRPQSRPASATGLPPKPQLDTSGTRAGQQTDLSVASLLASRTARVHKQLMADTSVSSLPLGSASSAASSRINSSSETKPPAAGRPRRTPPLDDADEKGVYDEGDGPAGDSGRAHAAVMNNVLSRSSLASRSMSHHDERRIASLEKRCGDLQMFLTESSKNSRRLTVSNGKAAALLHEKRQLVAIQLKELAALKLERDKAEADVAHLQHAVQKRTRELDHAEQSNIRLVEKRLSTLVEDTKMQEQARRQKVLAPSPQGRQASRSPPPPSPLTTSNLLQMEVTNRRLVALRASSPTAAVGSKFRYDEFGSPTAAGDVELFPKNTSAALGKSNRSGLSPTGRAQPSAAAAVAPSHFADPTINVSDVNKTQHVTSPTRIFAVPPPFVATVTAPQESSPSRAHDSPTSFGRLRQSSAGSPMAAAPPAGEGGNLDVMFLDAALQQQKPQTSAPGAAPAPVSPLVSASGGSADRRASVRASESTAASLDAYVFPAPNARFFAPSSAPSPFAENNAPFLLPGERAGGAATARKASLLSGRLANSEPQNTSYATASTTASEGVPTPEKVAPGPRLSVSQHSPLRSPPPPSSASNLATPPIASRQSLSMEKRASLIGLAEVPVAGSSQGMAGAGSFVEVSPPSPTVTQGSPSRVLGSTILSSSSPSRSQVMIPVELSSIIERNNDAIRRLSIEQGLGTPGRLRAPSLQPAAADRRPSAADIMNMSNGSLRSGSSVDSPAAPPRRVLTGYTGGVVASSAPLSGGHLYNRPSVVDGGDGARRASAVPESLQLSLDTSPLSRHRPSVR